MIIDDLMLLSDENYKNFHKKLIPTVDENTIIGVRTPELRRYARKIFGSAQAENFLKKTPHKYYDENNLHAFLIEQIKDFDECVTEVDRFLPFVDNWATCDMLRPKVFAKNKGKLFLHIKNWLKSDNVYTVRFAVVMLMTHFLDDDFDEKHLQMVKNAVCDEYYVNMAVAWYFSFALVKQYDKTIQIFENKTLKNKWVHNKSLQKARESLRISKDVKEYLKELKA